VIECDSADAVYEYALKGLGVAWLPWSTSCPALQAPATIGLGDTHLGVYFEVRV